MISTQQLKLTNNSSKPRVNTEWQNSKILKTEPLVPRNNVCKSCLIHKLQWPVKFVIQIIKTSSLSQMIRVRVTSITKEIHLMLTKIMLVMPTISIITNYRGFRRI